MSLAPFRPVAGDSPFYSSIPIRRYEFIVLFLACLLSSLWCATAARELGATFDEPFYVEAGLQRWRTGSYAVLMKYGTMPLPVDIQTLPIYWWEKSQGITLDVLGDFDRVLPWARAGNLVFWWMLLFYVWRIARFLGGPGAGLVALLFLAMEPSFIAHASLATTDIAATACLIALLYHYQRNRDEKGWCWRVAWPGLWFGLAVLAKAYGLVFGCLCLFFMEGVRCSWWRRRDAMPAAPGFWVSMRHLRHVSYVGLLVLFVYIGSDWKLQKSFVAWAQTLPEDTFGSTMKWLSTNLRIFSNAGEGLVRQVTHNIRGHGSFLLGETHRRTLWYYFPVLLWIKLTVPLLLGMVVLSGRQLRSRTWAGNWPLQAALAILLFTPICRVQIGIRFMFPMIALAIAGLAPVLVEAIRESSSQFRRRMLTAVTAGCLVWTATETALGWPDGVCYVNPLWGGTKDGYRLVSEGNYDWGQGVKELVAWHKRNELPDLDAWCFTTDPLKNRLPMRLVTFDPSTGSPEDFLRQVKGRRLAVSVTYVYGAHLERQFTAARAVLQQRVPVARTKMYLIYDFTDDDESPRLSSGSRP